MGQHMTSTTRHGRVAGAQWGFALALGAAAAAGGCAEPSCEETLTCPRSSGGTAGAPTGGSGSGTAGAATGGAGAGGAAGNVSTDGAGTVGTAGGGAAVGLGGSTGVAGGTDAGGSDRGGTAGTPPEQVNAGAAGADSEVCEDVTCQHGGSCEPAGATFKCECAPGYDGKYCEHDINECLAVPCLHGGSCTDGVNEYVCDCEGTGYFGARCEIAHFEWIGPPGSRGYAVSADGKVVVGELGGVPARWTAETGFQRLAALAEPLDQGAAVAVNADGTVIGGHASLPSGEGAFRWTLDTGVVSLKLSPDSTVKGVSADGNSMAGTTRPTGASGTAHMFRWTQSAGTEDLGDIGTGWVSGMSADGTAVVGVGSGSQSFRWTRAQGLFWLPGVNGSASAISGDGKTVIGLDNEPGGFFVYTDRDGYVQIETGDLYAQPKTVNFDGSVMAGHSPELEWVWDRSNGLRLFPDLLDALGVDPGNPIGRGPGYLYGEVYSVSADGKVFTGEASDADNQLRAWIARF